MLDLAYQLASAQSMASSFNSNAFNLDRTPIFAIQAVYTGSPVGTLKLQSSNDGTNWDDIAGSTVAVSAAGSQTWNYTGAGFGKVRLVYTATSGTGSLTATGRRRD